MKIKYHKKNRCKYLIKLHMIFVVKYRKPLLLKGLKDDIKDIMLDISNMKCSKFFIDTIETDKNHIHIILDIEPKVSVSSVVNRLKQISTHKIWEKRRYELKKNFWKENTFWSNGYFVCSIGHACVETVKKYIESQG